MKDDDIKLSIILTDQDKNRIPNEGNYGIKILLKQNRGLCYLEETSIH